MELIAAMEHILPVATLLKFYKAFRAADPAHALVQVPSSHPSGACCPSLPPSRSRPALRRLLSRRGPAGPCGSSRPLRMERVTVVTVVTDSLRAPVRGGRWRSRSFQMMIV